MTSDDDDVGRLTIDETAGDDETEEEAISSPISNRVENLGIPKKAKGGAFEPTNLIFGHGTSTSSVSNVYSLLSTIMRFKALLFFTGR